MTILIVDGKKYDNEEIVNVARDMELIRKLGPKDLEITEENQKLSKKKALATVIRAEDMKQRMIQSVFGAEVTQYFLKFKFSYLLSQPL